MAVPQSNFKTALEELIKAHLVSGEYPLNLLADLERTVVDVRGLVLYVGAYHDGHKEYKRP